MRTLSRKPIESALITFLLFLASPASPQPASAPAPDAPPDFNIAAYTEWFCKFPHEFPRQLTMEDDRDLTRLRSRLSNFYTQKKMAREQSLADWTDVLLGLVEYLDKWDNAIIADGANGRVTALASPNGHAFLAGVEGQPFLIHFRTPGKNQIPVLKTATADLGGRDGIRLTLDPRRPALFKLFLSHIKPGRHAYPITLLVPDGKSLYQGKIELNGVVPARVKVTIRDEDTGQPTEALLAMVAANGRDMPPNVVPFWSGENAELYTRGCYSIKPLEDNRVCIVRGAFEMPVYPGPCRVLAVKGPEYRLLDEKFDAPSGATVEKDFTLKRFVNMPQRNWHAADDHCHLGLDPAHEEDIMDLLSAVDLRLANLVQMGDEDRLYYLHSQWGEMSRRQRGGRIMAAGQEDPRTMWRGHTLMFNLQNTIHDRKTYFIYEDAFKQARAQGGLTGYAHDAYRFGGATGAAVSVPLGLVDFVELEGVDETDRANLYHFWNLGFRLSATNGADYPFGALPGDRRCFIHLEGENNYDKAMEAIRAGRVFSSTGGGFIEMRANGQLPGAVIHAKAGDTVEFNLEAQINPDYDKFGRMELIQFGKVIQTFTPPNPADTELKATFRLPVEKSCWVAARVFGATSHKDKNNLDLHESGAHTTPVYIVVDGQPHWDAKNLSAELDWARKNLDQMAASATQNTPLMNAQRPRLLQYVDQARAIYRKMEKGAFNPSEIRPNLGQVSAPTSRNP